MGKLCGSQLRQMLPVEVAAERGLGLDQPCGDPAQDNLWQQVVLLGAALRRDPAAARIEQVRQSRDSRGEKADGAQAAKRGFALVGG